MNISPSGTWYAVATGDGVRLYATGQGLQWSRALPPASAQTSWVAFNRDESLLGFVSAGRTGPRVNVLSLGDVRQRGQRAELKALAEVAGADRFLFATDGKSIAATTRPRLLEDAPTPPDSTVMDIAGAEPVLYKNLRILDLSPKYVVGATRGADGRDVLAVIDRAKGSVRNGSTTSSTPR